MTINAQSVSITTTGSNATEGMGSLNPTFEILRTGSLSASIVVNYAVRGTAAASPYPAFPGSVALVLKTLISTSGGTALQWRKDGRELFYAPLRLMAKRVRYNGGQE